jgi:chitin synthase
MSFHKADPENIQYQCVKLTKEYEERNSEEKSFIALKRAKGIQPIAPDTQFIPGSILADLAYVQDEPTKVEFMIEVSMYNEGVKNFTDTLGGICDNLESFINVGVDPSRIVCIIIVDGIRPFYSTFSKQQNFFSSFFLEDLIKERFGVSDVRNCKIPDEKEDDEFAHCFMQKVNFTENSQSVLNLIFCVKQKNKRKLNTHLWFFGGFCEYLNPNYVMLIDVGTMPLPNSLFYLYEAMATQKDLAGCCGEIRPMDPDIWKIVVPAQVVEYKFSHIFDKALESVLGYITVLPGAFSAYRWEALQGDPLWKDYFKSICHPELMNAFNSNIYLAEDRVLCLSLISKKKSSYLTRYVKKSVAETDVPENIPNLMSQRRRWINGSWFSLVDSIKKCAKIFESDHNSCRKCIFSCQMAYYVITILFSWVMVGSFYMAIKIVVEQTVNYRTQFFVASDSLLLTYLILLIFVFVMSLGVKPARVENLYKIISVVFGIFMLMTIVCTAVFVASLKYELWVVYLITATAGSFAIGIMLHCAIITILQGVFHYLFLTPTYVNIFLIYSICNIHDCTWGNRPDLLTQEEKNRIEEFEEFRIRWVIVWVLCNCGYVLVLSASAGTNTLYGLAFLGTAIVGLRFLGSIFYFFHEKCCKRSLSKNHSSQVVPLTRRASASINKLESRRASSFKHEKNPYATDRAAVQMFTDESENDNKEVEFMRRKSRKTLDDGHKVDAIFVEDVQTDTENSAIIREMRFKKGLGLKKLSEISGISIQRLREIEEGKVADQSEIKKIIQVIEEYESSE